MPTSMNFAVEQDKAEDKLPVLHIDSIWPPHLMKKRSLRSFKEIVSRKRIMIKFLSINPPPSPEPEKINVKDLETVLTINNRIKIIKGRQNLALERIKSKAKENIGRNVEKKEEIIHGVMRVTSNQANTGFVAGKRNNKGKENGKDPWYIRLSNTDKTLNINNYSVHKRIRQCSCQIDRRHPGLPLSHLPRLRLPRLQNRTNIHQKVINEVKGTAQDHGQPKTAKDHEHLVGKSKIMNKGLYKKVQKQNNDLDTLRNNAQRNESIAVSQSVRRKKITENYPKHLKGQAKFEPAQSGNINKKGKQCKENDLQSFRLQPLTDPRFARLQQALVNPTESKTLKREVRRISGNSWLTPLQSTNWTKH